MIIILNGSGLLVTIIGIGFGLFAGVGTHRPWVGVLVVALVWIFGSFYWRKHGARLMYKSEKPAAAHPLEIPPPRPPAPKMRWPSAFFVPLFAWGFLLLGMVPVALLAQNSVAKRSSDPRAMAFDSDDRAVSTSLVSGEVELANEIRQSLGGASFDGVTAEDATVLARTKPDAVLVLVRIKNLNKFSQGGKDAVAGSVSDLLGKHAELKDRKAYVGVKGTFLYGVTKAPPGASGSGQDVLLGFYGAAPDAPGAGKK